MLYIDVGKRMRRHKCRTHESRKLNTPWAWHSFYACRQFYSACSLSAARACMLFMCATCQSRRALDMRGFQSIVYASVWSVCDVNQLRTTDDAQTRRFINISARWILTCMYSECQNMICRRHRLVRLKYGSGEFSATNCNRIPDLRYVSVWRCVDTFCQHAC